MRVVVIADIHGNLAALEAVLAEVATLRPDRLIVAGDVVDGGPDSAACWAAVRALRARGAVVLRGNHERYVYDFGTARADPSWAEPQFAPLHYARGELDAVAIEELTALPFSWSDRECAGLLVTHASLRSDQDSVFAYTPEAMLTQMFPQLDPTVALIVRGHNHACATRSWGARRIVTSGSVGLAQDGNVAAQFVVLEQSATNGWDVRHVAVKYDVAATLRRFRTSGYLDRAGPMGLLFMREVATATHQIVPFLRFQSAARAAGDFCGLEEGVRRFLSAAAG
jgi:predicted phosphodiesterase